MLINQQFNSSYGAIYEQEYKKALSYVQQPQLLQDEIEREQKLKDSKKLHLPYPDPFPYRMTHYRGFVKYPDRLKNFVIAEKEPLAERRSFLPHIIDLEPNAHCNYRCVMCHVSEWKNGKRANNLKLEPFKQFIEDNPQLTEVKLHGMGEPLLHPDFFEMIRYLVEKDIWVRTSTNASVLHVKDYVKRLVDSGIGEVQVSFDGASKEVYEKIRRRGRFERVLENCILLNAYANRQDRLYTRMWVVVQKYNRYQLPEFIRIASKMGFRRLSLSLSLNEWGLDYWKKKNHKLQTDYNLSTREEQELLDTALDEGVEVTLWRQAGKYHHDKPKYLCPWVFARPYISCDLFTVPCAMIGNPDVSDLGNASNLQETWNSENYINLRRSHLQGNVPDICKLCYV